MNPKYRALDWFFLFLIALIWGSADILAKKSLRIFSPNEVGIIRVFVASSVLTPFAVSTAVRVGFEKLTKLFIIGILASVVPVFLIARSQAKLDSWINSSLNSLTPVMTLILARFLFKKHVSINEVIGIGVGFLGAIIVISGLIGSANGDVSYVIFPILASLCRALSTNLTSKYIVKTPMFYATAVSFIPYSVVMGLILFTQTDFLHKMQTVDHAYEAFGFVLLLTLASSILAAILFNVITRSASPLFASMATLIAPIISLVWAFLDGEKLTLTHYIGVLTILSGVYLLNKGKKTSGFGGLSSRN